MWRAAKLMNKKGVFLTVLFILVQLVGFIAMPTLTANIIDYGVAEQDLNYIFSTGALMLFIAVITVVGALLNVYFSARESQGLGETLRSKIFRKVVYFTNEEIDKFGQSTLITRSTNDIMQIQFVMMMSMRLLILQPLMILGSAILSFSREPKLAMVFFVVMPVMALLVFLIFRKANPYFRALQLKNDGLNRIFREGLTGIRVIRAFRKEDYEFDRFDEANDDFAKTSIKAQVTLALMLPLMTFMISVTNILLTWFGAQFISIGDMQVGSLVAFMSYAMLMLVGIMMISQALMFLPRGQVAAERIFSVLNTPNIIRDNKHPEPVDTNDKVTLEFNDVSYSYQGTDKPAIRDISFTVKPGETLAVIGGTGSGKSTLANLIPRLYDVTEGAVKINGTDIRLYEQARLRNLIGFATQNALLFSGTIRENLRYGKADATDEEMWHALDVAQSDFVHDLEGGLDARVEQGGTNFSGGQRQRLSIARALITDASLLVFDDSFSALDFKTDAKLRAALAPEIKDKAVVIIAQRISTVIESDTIIVLEGGELVGKGTHEELKENNETYQEIMESQMKGDDI